MVAMINQWCWRCNKDVPMLNEAEFEEMSSLYKACLVRAKNAMTRNKVSRIELLGVDVEEELFRPLVEWHLTKTGIQLPYESLHHHRLALYGPPCSNCGRLTRTPKATRCFECGVFQQRKGKPTGELLP